MQTLVLPLFFFAIFCSAKFQWIGAKGRMKCSVTKKVSDKIVKPANIPAHQVRISLYRCVYISFFLSYWLLSNLSITPGSANFEILTKNKKQNNNKTTTTKKNFWLNFCLNKECPKILCGLDIGHRRRQTIPIRNSSGEKGILQGISPAVENPDLSKPQISSTLNPSVLLPDALTQESANSGIGIALIGSDSF